MAEDGLLHTTELIKTALPYVDVRSKLLLDLLVKLYELLACLRNFRTKDIAACGFENATEKVDTETLLKKIRPCCNQKERAFVDKILNIFQAKRMFEMYNTYMEAMKVMEGFEGSSDNNKDENDLSFVNNFSDFDFSSIVGAFNNNTKEDKSMEDVNPSEQVDPLYEDNPSEKSDPPYEDNPQENKSSSSTNSIIEALKAMIPPEQMETFENLRMLFDSPSYDDNKKSEEDENKE